MQYAGGILLAPVQARVTTLIFGLGKMQTNPSHSKQKVIIEPPHHKQMGRLF